MELESRHGLNLPGDYGLCQRFFTRQNPRNHDELLNSSVQIIPECPNRFGSQRSGDNAFILLIYVAKLEGTGSGTFRQHWISVRSSLRSSVR
jgi:hypothetical protein